jgi:hypothetical protein
VVVRLGGLDRHGCAVSADTMPRDSALAFVRKGVVGFIHPTNAGAFVYSGALTRDLSRGAEGTLTPALSRGEREIGGFSRTCRTGGLTLARPEARGGNLIRDFKRN